VRTSTKALILAGLVVAVALVVFVAPFATSDPDGLERVAIDHGLDAQVQDHDLASSPFADYGVDGVDSPTAGTALAGIVGVVLVFGIGYGTFAATKRFGSR
jgi:hypothetical protein